MDRRDWIKRAIASGAGISGISSGGSPLLACLWDRDTLSQESRAFPGLTSVITGRFERNPDILYLTRILRVTEEVKSNPDLLSLYDDIAVANDRVKNSDEAILWAEEKRKAMNRLKDELSDVQWATHNYRYHANLGTFQIHRWIRTGSFPSDPDDVYNARDNIRKAIQINPDAHFGRERYQLMAIDWFARKMDQEKVGGSFIRKAEEFDEAMEIQSGGNDDPVRGLGGMIVLGDAWNSPLVFNVLAYELRLQRQGSLANLAYLRGAELEGIPFETNNGLMLEDGILQQNEAYFRKARIEADEWSGARSSYMESQIGKGIHPDTHAGFWEGFRYGGKPPKFKGASVQ